MATFTFFASGSTGNCALYQSGPACILIDAGTTAKYITACLRELGLGPQDLTHVLLTHGHSDHVSALPVLGKHTRARLVCSEATYEGLRQPWGGAVAFRPGEGLELLGCPVSTFATPHDAPGSCGFVLGEGTGRLAYCTDLGEVDAQVFYALAGSPTVVLESNHDVEMLRCGPYPQHLKRRVLSALGHLSNARCAQTAVALARQGARRLVLAHLSRENNTRPLALAESRNALRQAGAACGEVEVSVAAAVGLGLPLRLGC